MCICIGVYIGVYVNATLLEEMRRARASRRNPHTHTHLYVIDIARVARFGFHLSGVGGAPSCFLSSFLLCISCLLCTSSH